jgi:predicted esterase
MTRRALLTVASLALLFAGAAPAPAGDADPKQMKEYLALCDEWAAAKDDDAKLAVEAKAAALAPLPAEAVAPIAERLFDLAGKTGPKLKTSGRSYLYDEKTKKGFYMVAVAPKKRSGLLISMHGGGEGQGDAGSAHGTWSGATGNGMTVISPEVMTKVSSAWNEEPEERMVLELIEAAKRTWDIDTNRIYLAGHSMGGDGSWMIGGRNADLFAGCAPLAGSVMPYMKPGAVNKRPTPISQYAGFMEGVLPNLMHLHYYICHSADDLNEAIHPDDLATAHLKRLQALFPGKYDFHYDRADGLGHGLPKGGVKPILEWLEKKTRTTYPDEVVWETWWKWKRQMYWLYHPEPLEAWRFHAKVTGPNHVDVTATTKPLPGRENPKAIDLTILCSPKMFDIAKPLKVTSGKEVLFEGMVPRTMWSLLVSVARRNDPAQWFEGHVTVTVPRSVWRDLWDGVETPR